MWTSQNFRKELHKYNFDYDYDPEMDNTRYYNSFYIENRLLLEMEGLLCFNSLTSEFNTSVCKGCGMQICSSGFWVMLRRQNRFLFLVPDVSSVSQYIEIDEEVGYISNIEENSYLPNTDNEDYAYYYQKNEEYKENLKAFSFWAEAALLDPHKSFYMDIPTFFKLRQYLKCLNSLKKTPTFTKKEFVILYCWESPDGIFNPISGTNSINESLILETPNINIEFAIKKLKVELKKLTAATKYEIQPLEDSDEIISINIKTIKGDTEVWRALYKSNNTYGLILGGKFKIIINEYINLF